MADPRRQVRERRFLRSPSLECVETLWPRCAIVVTNPSISDNGSWTTQGGGGGGERSPRSPLTVTEPTNLPVSPAQRVRHLLDPSQKRWSENSLVTHHQLARQTTARSKRLILTSPGPSLSSSSSSTSYPSRSPSSFGSASPYSERLGGDLERRGGSCQRDLEVEAVLADLRSTEERDDIFSKAVSRVITFASNVSSSSTAGGEVVDEDVRRRDSAENNKFVVDTTTLKQIWKKSVSF